MAQVTPSRTHSPPRPRTKTLLPLLLLLFPSLLVDILQPLRPHPPPFAGGISYSDIRRISQMSSKLNQRRRYVESIRSKIRARNKQRHATSPVSQDTLYLQRTRELSLTPSNYFLTPAPSVNQTTLPSTQKSFSNKRTTSKSDRLALLGFHGDGRVTSSDGGNNHTTNRGNAVSAVQQMRAKTKYARSLYESKRQQSTSSKRGEHLKQRIADMAQTCEQAVRWINHLRRDVTSLRMDFMVMKSGLQVLETGRGGMSSEEVKDDMSKLWVKVEKVEEELLKRTEKLDRMDYRVVESERQNSVLSRRIDDQKSEVNRQEEYCHNTGLRLNEKYSGIEAEVDKIKDVVFHKLKLDNYVPEFADRQEEDLNLPPQSQSDEPEPGFAFAQPPPPKGQIPKDCSDIKNGIGGVYYIRPRGVPGPFLVFCEFESGVGWTVIQRRQNFQQDFNLGWESYKWGFGQLTQDHWLGNQYLNLITRQGDYKLHIDIQLKNRSWIWAEYHPFKVGNEKSGFELHVGNYSGNAGNALHLPFSTRVSSKAMRFTTNDRDNDHWPWNCAKKFGGGWWYQACSAAYLNSNWPLNRRWLDHFGLAKTVMRLKRRSLHKHN